MDRGSSVGLPLWGILAASVLYGGLLFLTDGSWLRWLYLLFLFFPAWEDGHTGEISDGWSLLLVMTGLLTSLHAGHLKMGLLSAGLMLLLYGLLYVLSKGGVGSGDVLLAGAAASWLTPLYALGGLWISCLAALLYVGISYLRGNALRGVRFAPFLALGGGVAYVVQEMALLPAAWIPAG